MKMIEQLFIEKESDRLSQAIFNKNWDDLSDNQKIEVNKVGWQLGE